MNDAFWNTFWDTLCAALPLFSVLFALNIVLLVLLGLSFPFLEPGSPSYYTSLMSASLLLVTLAGTVVVIRVCRRRS